MMYKFLRDDAREGVCDSMGELNGTTALCPSPKELPAGRAADDARERRRRR